MKFWYFYYISNTDILQSKTWLFSKIALKIYTKYSWAQSYGNTRNKKDRSM